MENKEICSRCGGLCCKAMGCHFSPEDFEDLSFEYLLEKIISGKYISIDAWEGNPLTDDNGGAFYYLRMRHVRSAVSFYSSFDGGFFEWLMSSHIEKDIQLTNEPAFLTSPEKLENIVDFSWGGQCASLTSTGCYWSHKDRPKGGRELIPVEDLENCESKYSKQQCAIDWMPYQDILLRIVNFCRNEL